MKEIPVCTRCGSTAVLADAYAEWDVERQDWVLHSTYDNSTCEDCEGECSLEWKQVPETNPPASEQAIGDVLGVGLPTSRAEAVNMILDEVRPFEGKQYAGLSTADRNRILFTWSRCASFLEAPARPIVKNGIVDLSWYQAGSKAA